MTLVSYTLTESDSVRTLKIIIIKILEKRMNPNNVYDYELFIYDLS